MKRTEGIQVRHRNPGLSRKAVKWEIFIIVRAKRAIRKIYRHFENPYIFREVIITCHALRKHRISFYTNFLVRGNSVETVEKCLIKLRII